MDTTFEGLGTIFLERKRDFGIFQEYLTVSLKLLGQYRGWEGDCRYQPALSLLKADDISQESKPNPAIMEQGLSTAELQESLSSLGKCQNEQGWSKGHDNLNFVHLRKVCNWEEQSSPSRRFSDCSTSCTTSEELCDFSFNHFVLLTFVPNAS